MPGQPAEAAVVLPGDIILAVGDQSLVGWDSMKLSAISRAGGHRSGSGNRPIWGI
jgi:C-terminal processing protease CtpA/Prc